MGLTERTALSFDGAFEHEAVEVFRDAASGLAGVVAVHSTAAGPAMGGLRIRRYDGISAAAVDAMRLARAMTYKNASAGLALGGGKAVLLDDGAWADEATRAARLRAFAEVLERLGGRYVTAEDVGSTPADMDALATHTRWVAGRSVQQGGRGDPSAATARTVHGAIAAAVGDSGLAGVHVGVLGAGAVGSKLAASLARAGARVTLADLDPLRAGRCAAEHAGVTAVPVEGFLTNELDVLAPCALGELITAGDVPRLRCGIVAGAANNPLVDRDAAVALDAAGILYVPDFLANAGGIIHVGAEVLGLDDDAVDARIEACIAQVGAVLADARESGRLPLDVALERAQAVAA